MLALHRLSDQRNLGMSMRVAKSTVGEVRARLAAGRANRVSETDGMDPEHRHDKTGLRALERSR